MGRKRKTLTAEQINEVETLGALLSQEQIADYFGIAKTTWYQILDREPEISARYKKGKARAIAFAAKGVLDGVREGDKASIFFYLKCQAGWKEKAEEPRDVQADPSITVNLIKAKRPE